MSGSEQTADRDPIEALADSFLRRYRAGERPGIEEYVGKYPELADEIRELLPALVELELNLAPEQRQQSGEVLPAVDASAPRQLGEYLIVREIGRGGMGVVYEAEQESLGRRVALKVLGQTLAANPQQRKRFEREARAAARLHHTNIVPVFGVGQDQGVQFYAMQYIQGLGLDKVLVELRAMRQREPAAAGAAPQDHSFEVSPTDSAEMPVTAGAMARSLASGAFQPTILVREASRGGSPSESDLIFTERDVAAGVAAGTAADTAVDRLSTTDPVSGRLTLPGQGETETSQRRSRDATYYASVARVGQQVADALQHAHDQGILHRDIKPSNLLLDARGTVWVTDFGLAKSHDQENLTQTGDVVGTLRYMAPEMFNGEADRRSDVYSLGLTMYELLAMRPAFEAANRQELIRDVLHGTPRSLRALVPGLPRDLVTIITKAIERDPALRYQSAGEFRDDLVRFLGDEPIQAQRVSLGRRLRHWCRRNPAIAALTGLVAVILVGVLIATGTAAVWFRDLAGEKDHALTQARRNEAAATLAKTDAEEARDEATAQKRQLSENVDLALQALEEVYLQFAEQRLTGSEELDDSDRRFLEKALQFYEQFASQKGDDPRTRSLLARAAHRVGTIERRLGQLGEASVSLSRATELWRGLVELRSSSLETRDGLIDSSLELGRVQRDLRQVSAAESTLRGALAEAERLSREAPAVTRYQELTATAHVELAMLLELAERVDEAVVAYRQGAQGWERLVEAVPESAPWQLAQADALYRLARLQRAADSNDELESLLVRQQSQSEAVESLAIVSKRAATLVGEAPRSAGPQTEGLARSESSLAELLAEDGRHSEADAASARAVELQRDLFRHNSSSPARRTALAEALLQRARGSAFHLRAAVHSLAEAEELIRPLRDLWPENVAYLSLAARLATVRGQRCFQLNRIDEAEGHLRRARELFERIDVKRENLVRDLASAEYLSHSCAKSNSRWDDAEFHLRRTIELQQTINQNRLPNMFGLGNGSRALYNHQNHLASLLIPQKRWGEAIETLRLNETLLRDHAADFGETATNTRFTTQRHLACAFALAGQPTEAARSAQQAMTSLRTASLDYRVRISTPGIYRLSLRGAAGASSGRQVYVSIVEQMDGPLSEHADWYLTRDWQAADGRIFTWNDQGFFEKGTAEILSDPSTPVTEPLLWRLDLPGEYTLRVLPTDAGFSLDALRLDLEGLVGTRDFNDPESLREEGVFLEREGRVVLEAEHFSERISQSSLVDSSLARDWRIVPGEYEAKSTDPKFRGTGFVKLLADWDVQFQFPDSELSPQEVDTLTVKRLLELLAASPESVDLLLALAQAQHRQQDDAGTIETCSRAIAAEGGEPDPRPWRLRGLARWRRGETTDSVADLTRSLELSRTNAAEQRAIRAVEFSSIALDCLRLRPDATPAEFSLLRSFADQALLVEVSPLVWRTHGAICCRAEDFEAALASYHASLELTYRDSLQPSNDAVAMACQGLAYTCARAGKNELAKVWYDFTADWVRATNLSNRFGDPVIQVDAIRLLGSLDQAGDVDSNGDFRNGDLWTELYQRLLQLDPDLPWMHHRLAQFARSAGDRDGLKSALDEIRTVHQRLIERYASAPAEERCWMHYRQGLECFNLKRYDEALPAMELATQADPQNSYAWYLRGSACFNLGRFSDAIEHYTRAIKLAPTDRLPRVYRAHARQRLKQWREAFHDWGELLELDPDDYDARFQRGHTAVVQGIRDPEVLSDLDWLIERFPEFATYRNNRAVVTMDTADRMASIAEYEVALRLGPADPVTWQNLAICWWNLGDRDQACAAYAKALSLNPLQNLADNLVDAYTISRELIRRRQDDPYVWMNRAGLELNILAFDNPLQGDLQAAEWSLNRAVELAPDDPRVRLYRGSWLLGKQRLDEAIADLRMAQAPVSVGTRRLNLGFEEGRLTDWTSTGTAFQNQPVQGDAVHARRPLSRSNHAGGYWVGTYEKNQGDFPQGTLTSVPFPVTHRWGSFLVGGGATPRTRVDIVRADTQEVVFSASGTNSEGMRRVALDLQSCQGATIFIRLIDHHSGNWGHINFDDFRFHDVNPLPSTSAPAIDGRWKTTEGRDPSSGADSFPVTVPVTPAVNRDAVANLGGALCQKEQFLEGSQLLCDAFRRGNAAYVPLYNLAYARRFLGDLDGHSAVAVTMLNGVAASSSPTDDEMVLLACATLPDVLPNYELALRIARRLLATSPRAQKKRHAIAACAALLRGGRAQEVLQILPPILEDPNLPVPPDSPITHGHYLWAIALAETGNGAAAADRLVTANLLATEELVREEIRQPKFWIRRRLLPMLRDEAERKVAAARSGAPATAGSPGRPPREFLPEEQNFTAMIVLWIDEWKPWYERGAYFLRQGYLAEADRDLTQAAARGRQLIDFGFWTAGPWPADFAGPIPETLDLERLQSRFNAEADADVARSRWMFARMGSLGELDLRPSADGESQDSAYVRAFVYAPEATESYLRLEHAGQVRVWCNGTLVYAGRGGPTLREFDEAVKVPLSLHRGRNTILIQSSLERDFQQFATRPGRFQIALRFASGPVERCVAEIEAGRWKEALAAVEPVAGVLRRTPVGWARLVALPKAAAGDREGYIQEGEVMHQVFGRSENSRVRRHITRALLAGNHPLASSRGREFARLEEEALASTADPSDFDRLAACYAALGHLRAGDVDAARRILEDSSVADPLHDVVTGLVLAARGERESARRHENAARQSSSPHGSGARPQSDVAVILLQRELENSLAEQSSE